MVVLCQVDAWLSDPTRNACPQPVSIAPGPVAKASSRLPGRVDAEQQKTHPQLGVDARQGREDLGDRVERLCPPTMFQRERLNERGLVEPSPSNTEQLLPRRVVRSRAKVFPVEFGDIAPWKSGLEFVTHAEPRPQGK